MSTEAAFLKFRFVEGTAARHPHLLGGPQGKRQAHCKCIQNKTPIKLHDFKVTATGWTTKDWGWDAHQGQEYLLSEVSKLAVGLAHLPVQ